MGTAQEDTFTLVGVHTDGERRLEFGLDALKSRVVRLEAVIRYLLQLSGESPDDFEAESVERYATALEAKLSIASEATPKETARDFEHGYMAKPPQPRSEFIAKATPKESE